MLVNEPEKRVREALGRLARPKTLYLETNRMRQLNSNAPGMPGFDAGVKNIQNTLIREKFKEVNIIVRFYYL